NRRIGGATRPTRLADGTAQHAVAPDHDTHTSPSFFGEAAVQPQSHLQFLPVPEIIQPSATSSLTAAPGASMNGSGTVRRSNLSGAASTCASSRKKPP